MVLQIGGGRPGGNRGLRARVSPCMAKAMRADAPFVLLDDARPGGEEARLYTDPVRVIVARTPDAVAPALAALESACEEGLHAAGYLAYEAGHALEPRLASRAPPADGTPLLWFGLFNGYAAHAPDAVPALLPDPDGAWIGSPVPREFMKAWKNVWMVGTTSPMMSSRMAGLRNPNSWNRYPAPARLR